VGLKWLISPVFCTKRNFPRSEDMSIASDGHMKEVGTLAPWIERFHVRQKWQGSHASGHTRMATESAVDDGGYASVFDPGQDLCLVKTVVEQPHRLRENCGAKELNFRPTTDRKSPPVIAHGV